jgi:hypothetical protein
MKCPARETRVLERLITDHRRTVTASLIALLCITLSLWLVRGPRPVWSTLPFLGISMLLIPFGYFGVYVFLYFSFRPGQISIRVLRCACGVILIGAVIFLAGSAAYAVSRFVNHRIIPPPNFLALGVALGAMKGWGLQRAFTETK